MADERDYPELDRLVEDSRYEALAEAAYMLMQLSRLDERLPPGQPMRHDCGCCADEYGYRLREHVCRADSSKVRRHCRRCDEPGAWTLPDLWPDHPADRCHGCTGVEGAV